MWVLTKSQNWSKQKDKSGTNIRKEELITKGFGCLKSQTKLLAGR